MLRPNVKVLKPEPQHKADQVGIRDDLGKIATELEVLALAVRGLGAELNDMDGDSETVAKRLYMAAYHLREVDKRLSPIDIEATKRNLDAIAEEVRS